MKKIVMVLLCVILAAASCLCVSAASSTSQIVWDPMGIIYKIDVGTTYAEFNAEMAKRGRTTSLPDSSDVIYTGKTISVYPPSKVSTYVLAVTGDVNGNGLVTTEDVNMINKCLAAKSAGTNPAEYFNYEQFYAADADFDGDITISDVMEVCKIIARQNA